MKKYFLPGKGALYYELEDYRQKYRKILFRQLFVKLKSKEIFTLYPQGIKNISIGLDESEVRYSSGKKVGKYGFYFENIEFYIQADNATNNILLQVNLPLSQQLNPI